MLRSKRLGPPVNHEKARALARQGLAKATRTLRADTTTVWMRQDGIGADAAAGPMDLITFQHDASVATGEGPLDNRPKPASGAHTPRPFDPIRTIAQDQTRVPSPDVWLAHHSERCSAQISVEAVALVGTKADTVLPAPDPNAVREGRHPAPGSPHLPRTVWKKGWLILRMAAGRYRMRMPTQALSHAQPPP